MAITVSYFLLSPVEPAIELVGFAKISARVVPGLGSFSANFSSFLRAGLGTCSSFIRYYLKPKPLLRIIKDEI